AGRGAGHDRGADPPGDPTRRGRRRVPGRDALGDDPGGVVQAHRPARVPDGADPPPLREAGLARAEDRGPFLDHLDHPRADLALLAEAALRWTPTSDAACSCSDSAARGARPPAGSPSAAPTWWRRTRARRRPRRRPT